MSYNGFCDHVIIIESLAGNLGDSNLSGLTAYGENYSDVQLYD